MLEAEPPARGRLSVDDLVPGDAARRLRLAEGRLGGLDAEAEGGDVEPVLLQRAKRFLWGSRSG
jgi:hypothetical protein